MRASQKTEISNAVLSYLLEHPDAQDTMEGIIEWWLMAHMIESRANIIKEAVVDLTSQQLLLEHQGKDLYTRYRINRRKLEEIKTRLEQNDNQK